MTGGPVAFSTNGALNGISHIPLESLLIITLTGDYKVAFSVSGVEPNQFTLFVNGTPIPGTTYGSGGGTQQNNGQAILSLIAGDILELVNYSSVASVTLQTLAGGSQLNVNASLIIEKIN
ncbi:MAG: hypothetical protein WDO73_05580 [Ignavibacteriota bacterium]